MKFKVFKGLTDYVPETDKQAVLKIGVHASGRLLLENGSDCYVDLPVGDKMLTKYDTDGAKMLTSWKAKLSSN